ncbi:hypothetical protein [Enterococcus casseliflavus]|uniref:hypothetical protein n=1 Tax=Enterococcus casseliflavus TaxID=37734 RepID=UPI003DA507C5
MSVSDVIGVISIVVSTILTIVSLFIAVKSLKQSQKSIELAEQSILDANRPYVVVYRDYIQILNSVSEYIIVKNFGNTGATIDSVVFTPELKYKNKERNIFENLRNTYIAPKQSISTVSNNNVFEKKDLCQFEVEIKYHNNNATYNETFLFNDDLLHDLHFSKSNPSSKKTMQEVLVKSSEEILRRGL